VVSSGYLTKTLRAPILPPTCAAYIPLLIICDLIIVVRFGEVNLLTDTHCKVKDCKTPIEMVNSCAEDKNKFLLKTRKIFFQKHSNISLFHRAFQFTIYNCPTNVLVCNKTLIQMSHIKTLKITPTCFEHQIINIMELFDPG
jgi:hypothetical protein